jgi:hypothetical protein
VWSELRAQPVARSGGGFPAWGYAAAALLVVVGLASVLLAPGVEETAVMEAAGGVDTPTAVTDLSGEEAAVTTVATSDPAAPAETVADEDFAAYAANARQGLLTFDAADGMTEEKTEMALDCAAAAGVTGMELLGELDEGGNQYAMLAPSAETLDSDTPIVFVDLSTCEIAHRDG